MLHKIVETGKTDDTCNNLLKYACYAYYQDYFFFLRQTRHADYHHRYNHDRDRHAGYHIWDRNCYDLKELKFSLKGPGITLI